MGDMNMLFMPGGVTTKSRLLSWSGSLAYGALLVVLANTGELGWKWAFPRKADDRIGQSNDATGANATTEYAVENAQAVTSLRNMWETEDKKYMVVAHSIIAIAGEQTQTAGPGHHARLGGGGCPGLGVVLCVAGDAWGAVDCVLVRQRGVVTSRGFWLRCFM